MKSRSIALAMLSLAAAPAAASDFDLNVNGDTARLAWTSPLQVNRRADLDLGALHRREDPQLTQLYAGVLARGDAGLADAKVDAGLGLRAQYLDFDTAEGGGAALGAELVARAAGLERVALRTGLWYQPEVLGFGDSEQQFEWSASLGYELIRDAELYLGYREVRVRLQDHGASQQVDDGAHVGLHIGF